ncbi:uncharacterized protein LOC135343854 isoform X3 [Halichondria panicea]|uniref:uncharacterized protein LOC135343854 isoform X3 n=1 Tax=Halichondria panicea TaxID=6063 RepID=UPI00312B5A12
MLRTRSQVEHLEDKAFNEVACKFEAKVQAQEEQKGSLSSAIETPGQNRHVNREYSILVHKKCQWNRYLQDSYTMNKFIRLLKRNGLLTKNQSRRSRKSFEQLFDCMLSLVKKDPFKLRSFTELLETITSEQLELESAVRCETELADQYTEPNGYHIHQARNNIKNKTYWKTLGTVFTVILFFAILIVYVFVPKNSNAGNDNGFILPNSTDRVDKGSIDVYKQTMSHNLPRRSSPFFGRENNLSRLTEILLKGNCIININGPPAFGKSSLAVKLG